MLAHSRGRRPIDDLTRPGLVVVDTQSLFCDPASPAFLSSWPSIAPRVLALVDAFLAAGRPVCFSRHIHPRGDPGGLIERFFGRLQQANDPLVQLLGGDLLRYSRRPGVLVADKSRHSVFTAREICAHLTAARCDAVVLAGVQTHLCVLASALDAPHHGLVPVVVADAVTARHARDHEAALRVLASGHAHVATAEEASAALPPRPTAPAQSDGAPPETVELLVVGAGPAGLSCGLQAARDSRRVLIVGDEPPGGLLRAAWRVENYPGIPQGISGAMFAANLEAQCKLFGMTPLSALPCGALPPFALVTARVAALEPREDSFVARLTDGRRVRARAVVLATGTTPVPCEINGFEAIRRAGRGHRDARTLPGDLSAGRGCGARPARVLVVGGGEGAMDAALAAAERGATVTLAFRRDTPGGSATLRRALFASGVALAPESALTGVDLTSDGGAVHARFNRHSANPCGEFEHILICIGRQPNLELPAALGLPPPRDVLTGRPGLLAAGDLLRPTTGRYLAAACGDGQRAAALLPRAWLACSKAL